MQILKKSTYESGLMTPENGLFLGIFLPIFGEIRSVFPQIFPLAPSALANFLGFDFWDSQPSLAFSNNISHTKLYRLQCPVDQCGALVVAILCFAKKSTDAT